MNKSPLYLPDTNTVLRYLLQDHPELSRKATDFWEAVRTGSRRAFIAEGVLLECVYVLQRFYKAPRQKIADSLSTLLTYRGAVCAESAMFEHSLALYRSCSLDFVDCMLAVRHRNGEGILFSFDEKLCSLATQSRV